MSDAVLLLTRQDVRQVLTIDDCIGAVEDAFRAFGEGRLAPPETIGIHARDGGFHIKAALADVFVAKINANFPPNPERHGLPTIQGLIVVMDAGVGTPLGVLDSVEITIMRTAAATAVAAKYLARADASRVTIAGCGVQGRAQLEAIARVRPVRQAFAFDASEERARLFASEMSSSLGIGVTYASSMDEAVRESDIVVTCTTSKSPLLERRHLHAGLFIAGVGADNPEKNELAPQLMAASRVVTDVTNQAAAMGDLHHALKAGAMKRDDVHGELAAVICGTVPSRTSEDEIFVFDSTGTALQDAATAALVLRRARERGIGREIAFA